MSHLTYSTTYAMKRKKQVSRFSHEKSRRSIVCGLGGNYSSKDEKKKKIAKLKNGKKTYVFFSSLHLPTIFQGEISSSLQ